MGLADIFSFRQFTSGPFLGKRTHSRPVAWPDCQFATPPANAGGRLRSPATPPSKTWIGGGRQRRNMLSAITLYRQSRPARHPATMTGHRQPEFAIGKVLVRLKVTRLTWKCNRASFVGPPQKGNAPGMT